MSGGEFSDGNPIVFGPKQEWVELYSVRQANEVEVEQAKTAAREVKASLQEERKDLLGSALERTETQPPELSADEGFLTGADNFIEHLGRKLQQARNVQENAGIFAAKATLAVRAAQTAISTAQHAYDASNDMVGSRARAIADQYVELGIPFPSYVVRAIGTVGVDGPGENWRMVAGTIEAFRYVHGVQREDIILGKAMDEPWSQSALRGAVNDIQHMQLIQIARSDNPKLVSSQLGRKGLLAHVGRPSARPRPEDMQWDTDTWLSRALAYLKSIEPTDQGLLIDKAKQ